MIKLASGLALAVLAVPSQGATLTEAHAAYDQNKVPEAERAYAEVAAAAATPAPDRAEAEIELARIAWLVRGEADAALSHLTKARSTGAKLCESGSLEARILREAKRGGQAIARGAMLLAACDEASQRDDIRTRLIGSRLDLAYANPSQRAKLFAAAGAEAEKLTSEAGIEGSRVRLELALLTDRADAALAAWKEYFWLDDTDAPQALIGYAVTTAFRRGLVKDASFQDRLKLADLLMRSGFAEQSKRYALSHGLPGAATSDPTWLKLDAYWREREKLDAALLTMNRKLVTSMHAAGPLDQSAMDGMNLAAKDATIALMKAAGTSGEPKMVLLKNYGLVASVGTTSGYPSIHMGHVIEDHDDEVSQYGHTAKIHFRAIDNMIANGFESWLWDGSAAVGGWTGDGVIVHVRPRYVSSPMGAYRLTQDGADRRRLLERQAKRGAEDAAKLKVRPVATLEGLSARLQLQLVDQIAAGARSRGGSEADIRRSFLAEFSRANLNQSIRVHEGRHAIDNSMGLGVKTKVDQAVLEYNAKLSELALTAYPRMALRNMNRNLEGNGPHDRGGARLFDDYRKWMEAHTDQIMGYDPGVPVLAQFDKLTDSQIREIAMSLDPLARKS